MTPLPCLRGNVLDCELQVCLGATDGADIGIVVSVRLPVHVQDTCEGDIVLLAKAEQLGIGVSLCQSGKGTTGHRGIVCHDGFSVARVEKQVMEASGRLGQGRALSPVRHG